MSQNYLKQVMVVDEQMHNSYLEDFKEEKMGFWTFVNFMLGTLYDDEHIVEQIIPINDGSSVLVIYRMKICY